jgi:hypothetical protein
MKAKIIIPVKIKINNQNGSDKFLVICEGPLMIGRIFGPLSAFALSFVL